MTVRACRRGAVLGGLGLHHRDGLDVVIIDDVAKKLALLLHRSMPQNYGRLD